MRLMIKQCKEDSRARFLVLDESGGVKFHILGEQRNKGGVLSVRDPDSNTLGEIRQRGFLLLCGYGISVAGVNCATVIQNLYNLHTMLRVSGVDWRLRGDFRTRSFDLVDQEGNLIMTHARQWGVWGDGYELNLSCPEHEILCLCIALCIDWAAPSDGAAAIAVGS